MTLQIELNYFIYIAVSFAVLGYLAIVLRRRFASPDQNNQPASADTLAPIAKQPNQAHKQIHLELHLVLNVLNHVVMALGQNEKMQDGVALLSDYLRSNNVSLSDSRADQDDVVSRIEAYWRLSRWKYGQMADALRLELPKLDAPTSLLVEFHDAAIEAIRDLEGSSAITLKISANAQQADGLGWRLRGEFECTAHAGDIPPRLLKAGGWQIDGNVATRSFETLQAVKRA